MSRSNTTPLSSLLGTDKPLGTQMINTYPFDFNKDTTVWLVDTPGFDDAHLSDTDVLREIATWLSNSYKDTAKLHGIIYLHRITDNKLGGSAMRNLHVPGTLWAECVEERNLGDHDVGDALIISIKSSE